MGLNNKTSFPQTFVINEVEVSDKNKLLKASVIISLKLAFRLCHIRIDIFQNFSPCHKLKPKSSCSNDGVSTK